MSGPPPGRQPAHTLYGGAHLFSAATPAKLGARARDLYAEVAPDPEALMEIFALPPELAGEVHPRVVAKLAREPIEDLRVDFEDGFGVRDVAEEDAAATATGRDLAAGMAARSLPPFIGIRVRSFAPATRARATRTLELVLRALAGATSGALPDGFVVTVPKVVAADDVSRAVDVLEDLERELGLPTEAIRLEIMVEAPEAIVAADGSFALPGLVRAARGRCRGAHFGTYDYTASLGVSATRQRMRHPACDFARSAMQASLAGTGVFLSDGATTLLPLPATDRASVLTGWRALAEDVADSLDRGFYQGWTFARQLPARWVTLFAFLRAGLTATCERLRRFVEQEERATRSGAAFDDAATGRGLVNHVQRALRCGAATEEEIVARTGLDLSALQRTGSGRV